jgi:hypothetical protein
MTLPPRVLVLQPARRAVGDAVEPGTQEIGLAQRGGFAGKDQECRLEGVLGVVRVAEQALTDAKNQRPMPDDQGREGRFRFLASASAEPFQQLAVGQSRDRPAIDDCSEFTRNSRSHDPCAPVLPNFVLPFLIVSQAEAGPLHFSWIFFGYGPGPAAWRIIKARKHEVNGGGSLWHECQSVRHLVSRHRSASFVSFCSGIARTRTAAPGRSTGPTAVQQVEMIARTRTALPGRNHFHSPARRPQNSTAKSQPRHAGVSLRQCLWLVTAASV